MLYSACCCLLDGVIVSDILLCEVPSFYTAPWSLKSTLWYAPFLPSLSLARLNAGVVVSFTRNSCNFVGRRTILVARGVGTELKVSFSHNFFSFVFPFGHMLRSAPLLIFFEYKDQGTFLQLSLFLAARIAFWAGVIILNAYFTASSCRVWNGNVHIWVHGIEAWWAGTRDPNCLCVGRSGIVILPCHLLAYCFINASRRWLYKPLLLLRPPNCELWDLLFPFPQCPVDECLLDTISGCGILASCRVALVVRSFHRLGCLISGFWVVGRGTWVKRAQKVCPACHTRGRGWVLNAQAEMRWALCRNVYLWDAHS